MTEPRKGEPWLEVDLDGFRQILHNKGVARVALEPLSNALDTEAKEIEVRWTQSQGWAELEVVDDDPDGFKDLRDSYMLFAPSTRRDDPTKRGRFGQGEKELIAVCAGGGEVMVESTTGTVLFEKEGRRRSRRRREAGTRLFARLHCNQGQSAEFVALVRSLLIPAGVKVSFNGEVLQRREPAKVVWVANLPTKITDEEGNLKDTTRSCNVELVDPAPGEQATIYELGVPVVEHDGRWHVNVGQKIPLNAARDNVTPSYLRRLREVMLNETVEDLTEVDMKKAWVAEALPAATPEVLRMVVERIHGRDAVIYDPSNREASKRAIDEGRTVVYGRQFTPETWERIRANEILLPAGRVIETGVPSAADGVPPTPKERWSPGMHRLAEYTHKVGRFLLGYEPRVEFTEVANRAQAWWGGQTITFNLRILGKRWPEDATQEAVDALLIHEFAHDRAADHFSDAYNHATCSLGARLRWCPEVLRAVVGGGS